MKTICEQNLSLPMFIVKFGINPCLVAHIEEKKKSISQVSKHVFTFESPFLLTPCDSRN